MYVHMYIYMKSFERTLWPVTFQQLLICLSYYFYVPASSYIPKFAPSTHSFSSGQGICFSSLFLACTSFSTYIMLSYSFKYIGNTNENEKGEEVQIFVVCCNVSGAMPFFIYFSYPPHAYLHFPGIHLQDAWNFALQASFCAFLKQNF